MKFLVAEVSYFLRSRTTKRNIFLLLRFFLILAAIVATYSVLFHVLMLLEGKEYSWITGIYWTLTVMSTLGFGDITFKTDIGLIFSIIVLMTGIVYLLVMLPFTFIQFFYAPWLEAQSKSRTPRELPEDTKGHIILTGLGDISRNLVKKLPTYNYDYVMLVDEMARALELYDKGYKVVVGDYGDPETYRRLRVEQAAMVVATMDDTVNTSITFTIRDISKTVPIITTANHSHSLDILAFAGSSQIFHFTKMLGRSLGNRVMGASTGSHIIWQHDELTIAEAPAMRTSLEGKTLIEADLRRLTGVTVVGVWQRGTFIGAKPTTEITSSTILVVAGTAAQIKKFDEHFSICCQGFSSDSQVLILGGGRVGNAAAKALAEQKIPYKIVEKRQVVSKDKEHSIYGNAADRDILDKAGIMNARSVIITTHDDDMNIYLTIYCRQLRPDVQIITRANAQRTVSKLHRAGADLVMSYASMACNSIIDLLTPEQMLMIEAGLSIFRSQVRHPLIGKSLADSELRARSGCSVVAVIRDGSHIFTPDPFTALEENDELVLVGTVEGEKKYLEEFS